MGLTVKIVSYFGVLEYWKKPKPKIKLELVIPLLHHSINPPGLPDGGKTRKAPLWQPKAEA